MKFFYNEFIKIINTDGTERQSVSEPLRNKKGENEMKKRISALMIALACTVTCFSGCGDKQTAGSSDYSEHYTYTINMSGADKQPKESYKQICEKFNIDFEFIPITSGDWQEKTRIWMATGDMPDILWANIQNFNFSEYRNWAEEGLLKEIKDYSEYPNIKKIQDSLESAPYFKVDGKQYAYLSANIESNPDDKHFNVYSFLYRRDWAQQLGLATDDNVYTWDQFLEIGKGMTQKLGKIGLVGSAGTYPHFSGMMQISPYWEQYTKVDGEYKWGMDLPETLDAIKMSKRIYDEGILWQDMVIATGSEGNDKFKAGEAGICFENCTPGTIKKYMDDLEKSGVDNPYDKVAVMNVKAPNGYFWGQECMDYWTINCYNPDMSDEKLDRLLQMYDYMLSGTDEVKQLYRYGVEGKDYTLDDNGVPQLTNEDASNLVLSSLIYNDKAFNTENLRVPEKARQMGQGVLDILNSDQCKPRQYDYPLYFFSAPNKDKYGLFYEDGRTKIKQIIMSSSNVDGDWEAWKATVRDKVQLVLDELNEGLK